MDPEKITSDAVQEALRAIRQAEPLSESLLLHLEALGSRLRLEGQVDSPQSREALLGPYLEELVWERLDALRGPTGTAQREHLTPGRELQLLDSDFSAGSAELEAWSVLYVRYFASSRAQLQEVASRLAVSRRTLRRRAHEGYRLLADQLRERELTAATRIRHNLPHALTRFIGRESEIGGVRALLAQHRLVTLTGAGGIGKSRLAVETARALVGDYRDGVWLVELGPVSDGSHVAPTVAAVFGVGEQPGRTLLESLTDHLKSQRLLLLLDNCEQVIEASGEITHSLLARCGEMQVLATSRERLHVAGEAVWTVPPLSVPGSADEPGPAMMRHYDAVRLFVDRAAAVMPAFELTADTAASVADVCTALDGIPLAMELAASRMRMLSVSDLAERLGGRFELLRDGRRPQRPHHETLWATIDWSHALLSEKEQVLFRRLSVFRGGWTLEAAEDVCEGDVLERGEIIHLLEQLVDKSVVAVEGTVGQRRYRMLATTGRYAQERLAASGDDEAISSRHLDHYLRLAEASEAKLKSDEQAACLDRLIAEQANLRAALAWAITSARAEMGLSLAAALGRFWELQGYFREGRRWLADCLALPDVGASSAIRGKALSASGALAEEQGDYDAAQALHGESLAIRRELGDVAGTAESLNNLGNVANMRGDYEAAHELHAEALGLRRQLGDQWGIAVSLNNLGNIANFQADFDSARGYYEESAGMFREMGDRWGLSAALGNLGMVALYQGDHDRASGHLEDSLAISRELGDRQGMAYSLNTLGDVAMRSGDLSKARSLQRESLSIAVDLGDTQGVAEVLKSYALIAKEEGDPGRAVLLFGAADALREATGAAVTESDLPEVAEALSALRRELGDDEFEAFWSFGRGLSEEAAAGRAWED